MKSLVIVLLVCGVSAAPTAEKQKSKRARGQCTTSIGRFNHGDWVSPPGSPCLKYRCNSGRLRFEYAGCPADGKCYRINETWPGQDCHSYRCEARDYNSYETVRITSGCIDAYRRCRRPGEVFPYPIHGRIYRRCSCTTTPSSIKYSCEPQ